MADTGRQANWLACRVKERMSDERVPDFFLSFFFSFKVFSPSLLFSLFTISKHKRVKKRKEKKKKSLFTVTRTHNMQICHKIFVLRVRVIINKCSFEPSCVWVLF